MKEVAPDEVAPDDHRTGRGRAEQGIEVDEPSTGHRCTSFKRGAEPSVARLEGRHVKVAPLDSCRVHHHAHGRVGLALWDCRQVAQHGHVTAGASQGREQPSNPGWDL